MVPRFHRLIERFASRTGVPMLLNTSLNVMGEPIVETPEDALWCLISAASSTHSIWPGTPARERVALRRPRTRAAG